MAFELGDWRGDLRTHVFGVMSCGCTGITNSPALVLAHELGHSWQTQFGTELVKNADRTATTNRYSQMYMEVENIKRGDWPIATELGENRRCSHAGTRAYDVNSPTNPGTKHAPPVKDIDPLLYPDSWFWGAYEKGYVDVLGFQLPIHQERLIKLWEMLN